ncbi:hypothetical protein MBM_09435 [Drepanopeziza brunnea f. sp. 'multigermtubi' MB_m1]|uniref:Uncharacterized protein n=1 Tax=Marssonina brunnea f. sp. multigermtubi (strain MB_m1) TaxID=1072389 RepID=K1WHQ0_MARBU|nr:uncharacterized protein MBM_09435 [Drepanopeziza brunnea f. sp. 'multigermtubi' MB_m1]EKD12401.1 hypothetical protein MBM_09435 [Drepanopeziza brunnea f. sp. 'multigermtubi' MB_m1]
MAPNRLALSPAAPARLAIEEYVLGVEARGYTLIGGNDPNSVFTESSQKEKVPFACRPTCVFTVEAGHGSSQSTSLHRQEDGVEPVIGVDRDTGSVLASPW